MATSGTSAEQEFRNECGYVAQEITWLANRLAQLSNDTLLNHRWGKRRLIFLDAAVTVLYFTAEYVRNLRMF